MSANRFNSNGTGVILESAQNIPMHSPQVIWKDWIYWAKVHILAGPPSTGKTTMAIAMAATISTGGFWPDGSPSPRGRVVIWSSEDGIEDTIIPRLVAAGANLANIDVVRRTEEGWMPRPFDPVRDLRLLEDKIRELRDVVLVIVDSIADLMPGSPGNNNKVRKSLLPLVGLAERTNCAVLGLTHVVKASKKKHPLERIIGGVGLGAVVRVAMLVARDDSGGYGAVREWSVLVKAKANICREDGGFLYRTAGEQIPTTRGLIESSKVEWGASLQGTAMDILNRAEATDASAGGGKFQEACDFLNAELENGPRPGTEVEAMAEAAGISKATLRRAREQLGLASQKQYVAGSGSSNVWSLPAQNGGNGMAGPRSIMDMGVSISLIAPGHLPKGLFGSLPTVGQPIHGVTPNERGDGASVGRSGYPAPPSLGVDSFVINGAEQTAQAEQVEQVEQAGMVAAILGYALDEVTREIACRPLPAGSKEDEVAIHFADVVESVARRYYGDLTQPERQQLFNALWAELPNCISVNQQ